MKKYISTALALCMALIATSVSAQEQESQPEDIKKLTWGVKTGLNISSTSLHGDDKEGRPEYRVPKFGFSGGVTAEYKFNKEISLSTEVLFSQMGVKYKYPTVEGGEYDFEEDDDGDDIGYLDSSECKVVHRFSYINVPIIFNYYFIEGKNLSFNVGIQMGFLVGENSVTKFEYLDGSTSKIDGAFFWDLEPNSDGSGTYVRNDAGYRIFDLGVPIGFTWGFNNNITLDARYTLGVLNTFKETSDYDYDKDFGSTNNSLTISVGYKF